MNQLSSPSYIFTDYLNTEYKHYFDDYSIYTQFYDDYSIILMITAPCNIDTCASTCRLHRTIEKDPEGELHQQIWD